MSFYNLYLDFPVAERFGRGGDGILILQRHKTDATKDGCSHSERGRGLQHPGAARGAEDEDPGLPELQRPEERGAGVPPVEEDGGAARPLETLYPARPDRGEQGAISGNCYKL